MLRRTPVCLAVALSLAAAALPATVLAQPAHCPPGHAKKGWCSPGPKYVFRRGDRIPRDAYVVIEDYGRYGYGSPPSGHGYVRVDGEIFLIALATGLIIEALR